MSVISCPVLLGHETIGRGSEAVAGGGVTGIRVGSIVEKLVLYADNLILFFHDPGPSLSEALRILAHFLVFLLILPIDPGAKEMANDSLPLQWATSI